MSTRKRIVRSNDRVIAGVCSGLANYLDMDVALFRIIYAILTVCTAFSGIIIYLICWLVMPEE
ncbi:MAG TPA: PspC domain-containing protein [Prevotella sp.]